MSGIREWAQQAAGNPATEISLEHSYPHAAIFSNLMPDPLMKPDETTATTKFSETAYADFYGLDAAGTFHMAHELYSMRTDAGGNPFTTVAAAKPDEYIAIALEALKTMKGKVNTNSDIQLALPAYVTNAMTEAKKLLSDDAIGDTISALEARLRTDHLSGVGRMNKMFGMAGRVLNTQYMGMVALSEDGYQRTLAEKTYGLRLDRDRQREQITMQLIAQFLQGRGNDVSLAQALLGSSLDAMRIVTTIKQDQIDKDVNFTLGEVQWDFNLLQEAMNANASIYGAQMVRRAQTNGERLAATLSGAVSTTLQGYGATGSPTAGLALGGFSALTSMLSNA